MTGVLPQPNTSAGGVPALVPFQKPVANPPEGPAYVLIDVTVPAGQKTGEASVNLTMAGMSICQSIVINNTANASSVYVQAGSQFAWRVPADGIQIVPVYWAGGIIYITATIPASLSTDMTLQIGLFNTQQTPASIGSVGIQGVQGAGGQVEVTPTRLGNVAYQYHSTIATYPSFTTIDLTTVTNPQYVYAFSDPSNTSNIYLYTYYNGIYFIYDVLTSGSSRSFGDNGGIIIGGNASSSGKIAAAGVGANQIFWLTVWSFPQ